MYMILSVFYYGNCWKRPVTSWWTGRTRSLVHPSRKTPYLRIYRDTTRPSITRTWMRWTYVSTGRSYKSWTLVTEGTMSSVAPKFGTKVALWCVQTDWIRSSTPNCMEVFTLTNFPMTIEIHGVAVGLGLDQCEWTIRSILSYITM